jgi:WD40 repeat protein
MLKRLSLGLLVTLFLASSPSLFSQSPAVEDIQLVHTVQLDETSFARLVTWNPHHDWIAYDVFTASGDGYVRVTDTTTLADLVDIPARPISFTWNSDGSQIAILSQYLNSFDLSVWAFNYSGTLTIEKVQSISIDWTEGTYASESSIDWHPLEAVIALADGSDLYFINLNNSEIELIEAGGSGPTAIAWTPSGEYVAVGTPVASLRVIRFSTQELVIDLKGNDILDLGAGLILGNTTTQTTQSLAWSPDEETIALHYGFEGMRGLYLVNINSQEIRSFIVESPVEQTEAIAWSPNGEMIATVGGNFDCMSACTNTISILDPETLEILYQANGDTDVITSVSWSSDSQMIATGSIENNIRIWGILAGE